MRELFTKYAQHLDDLRRQSGIKTMDFCDGICDDRTYRRYLSGEISMTQPKLSAFCERLGLSVAEFDRSFNRSDIEESQVIYKLLRHIQTGYLDDAKKLLVSLEHKTFLSPRNKELYEFAIIKYNLRAKKINSHHAYDLLSKLIDYPNCTSKQMFDLIDIIALQDLAVLEASLDQTTALDVLTDLLNKEKIYITSDERYFLPPTYAYVANVLGRMDRIRESLDVSKLGIEFCLAHSDMYALEHLYYYHSLSLYHLGHTEESRIAATKSLLTATVKNNHAFVDRMMRFMKTDFGIDPKELMTLVAIELALEDAKQQR